MIQPWIDSQLIRYAPRLDNRCTPVMITFTNIADVIASFESEFPRSPIIQQSRNNATKLQQKKNRYITSLLSNFKKLIIFGCALNYFIFSILAYWLLRMKSLNGDLGARAVKTACESWLGLSHWPRVSPASNTCSRMHLTSRRESNAMVIKCDFYKSYLSLSFSRKKRRVV